MKKLFLGCLLFAIALSPTVASGADEDKGPKGHVKLDICHNETIIPVSIHAAEEVETGHGLYDPVTHNFTARVETPGHDGDTLVRVYVKAGNEEIELYSNPNSSCTDGKAPDSARKIHITICVDGELKLFEGTDLKELQARVDAFVKLHALDQNIKVGTDCIPVTTTTTVKRETLPEGNRVGPPEYHPGGELAVPGSDRVELPRTGSGVATLAIVGAILGILGLTALIGAELIKRLSDK